MFPEPQERIWMLSNNAASMIIGTSMGREICLIRGQVSLNFVLLKENHPNGYVWSGRRLTRRQLTSRPDHLWPEIWKTMGKNAKLKEKQKCSNEKLHLDNARVLPYLCERPVTNPSIWKESLSWIGPWIRYVRGWNLEG